MRLFSALLVFVFVSAIPLAAETVDDLARIHREAIGGSRLDECQAVEASGVVRIGGRELQFEMVAARPNRVRLTMRAEGRTLVQVTDGVNPPWQSDSAKTSTVQTMSVADGREFNADAEFDDPLASAAERGYALDFAGEVQWQDRRMLKLLVTRRDSDPSFLLLDPETYFIVARLTKRRLTSGREVTVETQYDDYQPVGGVIFPHRVDVLTEGKLTRQTLLTNLRVIPEPGAEVFARPMLAEPVAKPGGAEEEGVSSLATAEAGR